jgi:hypothetical protein
LNNLINILELEETKISPLNKIISSYDQNKQLMDFKTFDVSKLNELSNSIEEINRANNIFGKNASQISSKLMSLTMLASTPITSMKQCLAQIESRRQALKDNTYSIKRSMIELEEMRFNLSELEIDNKNKFKIAKLKLDIEEKESSISEITCYYEGALKELAIYISSYNQIKESNNIPDNWDEKFYLEREIEHFIKLSFRLAVRDLLMTSRLNCSTVELMEQIGINPITGLSLAQQYVNSVQELIHSNKYPTIEIFYEFLNNMVDIFKNDFIYPMKYIGLDESNLIEDRYLFKDV